MIVQNHSTPWVVLAVIVMGGCLVGGMLLGNAGPLNTRVAEANIPAQQTQGALSSQATQSSMELVLTQQAPAVGQTAMAGQLTMIPLQQMATQVALSGELQAVQVITTQTAAAAEIQYGLIRAQATQTSMANNMNMQNLAWQATATTIGQQQAWERSKVTLQNVIPMLGLVLLSGWIITRGIVSILYARAKEKEASARQLTEQQRLVSLLAHLDGKKGKQVHQLSNPTSLIKQPSNGKGFPKTD
jgi:hypothetical protein